MAKSTRRRLPSMRPSTCPIWRRLRRPKLAEDVNDHEFQFNPNVDSFNEQEATEFSVKVDYDLGWADLIGWGLYSDIQNNLGADGTSGAFGFFNGDTDRPVSTAPSTVADSGFQLPPPQFLVPGDPGRQRLGPYTPTTCDGTQYQERNQKDYSFEVRLRSKSDQRLRWEAGLYYLNIDREVGVNLGIDTGQRLDRPESVHHQSAEPDRAAGVRQLQHRRLRGLRPAGLRRHRQRRAGAGTALRPGRARRDQPGADRGRGASPSSSPAPAPRPSPVATRSTPACAWIRPAPARDKSKNFDQFQPKLSVRWDAIRQSHRCSAASASASRAAVSTTSAPQATVERLLQRLRWQLGVAGPAPSTRTSRPSPLSDDYREETSTSVELGFKSDVGDALPLGRRGLLHERRRHAVLRVLCRPVRPAARGVEHRRGGDHGRRAVGRLAGHRVAEPLRERQRARFGDQQEHCAPGHGRQQVALHAGLHGGLRRQRDVCRLHRDWTSSPIWASAPSARPGSTRCRTSARPTIFQGLLRPGQPWRLQPEPARHVHDGADLRLGLAGENWSVVAFGNNIIDEDYLEEVIPAIEFGGSFITRAPCAASVWKPPTASDAGSRRAPRPASHRKGQARGPAPFFAPHAGAGRNAPPVMQCDPNRGIGAMRQNRRRTGCPRPKRRKITDR